MTLQQLRNKISSLDFWLKSNPKHYNYVVVLRDKQELERKLAEREKLEE
ncbi:hypothetical protein [Flavobacterium beibuense]